MEPANLRTVELSNHGTYELSDYPLVEPFEHPRTLASCCRFSFFLRIRLLAEVQRPLADSASCCRLKDANNVCRRAAHGQRWTEEAANRRSRPQMDRASWQFADLTSRRLKKATDRWIGLRMDRGGCHGGFWSEEIIDTPIRSINLNLKKAREVSRSSCRSISFSQTRSAFPPGLASSRRPASRRPASSRRLAFSYTPASRRPASPQTSFSQSRFLL